MDHHRQHWENVYRSKGDADVSWTQAEPRISLELVERTCPGGGRVIDVGGGTSPLAARLLERGYTVAVVDLSPAALARAAAAMGDAAQSVRWIDGDVTDATLDLGTFDVWHDRAVFHFLTGAAERAAYRTLLARTLPTGGHAIIATFSPEGPETCSGLQVRRYDAATLARELGEQFELRQTIDETHLTPWGKPQAFQYSLLRRR